MCAYRSCWICGCSEMELVRRSTLPATQLNSEDFRITDSGYGRTAALYRCAKCHFRQAADLPDVLRFYERLEDAEYVGTWKSRAKQARQLLERLIHFGGSGRLLDIGAGSGILVEAALQLGFAAEGVEPSAWLQAQSATRRLPVHHGTLPHSEIHGPYDTVTIIDVIEHVSNPVELLTATKQIMRPGAIGLLVTPDVDSLMARLMGFSWWHYRIAHVGYFNRHTLEKALRRSGLEPVAWERAGWYFPADYLAIRLLSYIPAVLRPPLPRVLQRFTVRLNLFDSFLVVFRNPVIC
jgi:SAM-dependent methyltransferase